MTRAPAVHQPTFDDFGLSAYTFTNTPARPHEDEHTHMELEMVLVQSGSYDLKFAGTVEHLRPEEIALFWAGIPHLEVGRVEGAIYHVAQIPIVQVLSWTDSAAIIDRLLMGQVLRLDADPIDMYAFARWSTNLATGDPHLRSIVELEMHARLRRFLFDFAGTSPSSFDHTTTTVAGVADAIRYVLRHFMEHISVDDIAAAVGWHRTHLMQSFHRVCGVTIWEYVIRARLTEAQRLLAATDLPTLTIAHRAGFTSTSRMYETFRRYCGTTPSEYRDAAQSQRSRR